MNGHPPSRTCRPSTAVPWDDSRAPSTYHPHGNTNYNAAGWVGGMRERCQPDRAGGATE